jgi:hypothetical protein
MLLFNCVARYLRKLEEKEIYFGSQFQRIQAMDRWVHCFLACGKAGQLDES